MSPLHNYRMRLRRELEAPASLRKLGTGWVSGTLGVALGLASLALILAFRFPGIFGTKELLGSIPPAAFRVVVLVAMLLAFFFSMLSLLLRKDPYLGTVGMGSTLLASILAGTLESPWVEDMTPLYFGLDFFVLNVAFTGILFIPLETLFPHKESQALFRHEWREDMFYYLVSSMMVQVLTLISLSPAKYLAENTNWDILRGWVASLPLLVQIVAIVFLTDLVQYWVHRAFHRFPFLWKFHAVHHSAKSMDWMAGARMHFMEICILRGTTVLPMFLLGFTSTAINIYIFLVYLWSTFVHANVGWRLKWIEWLLVMPRFHHWHHGIEKEAIDVNFAVHFPWLDRLFGTYHLPADRWPDGYGVEGHPVPSGYVAQFLYPFRRSANKPSDSTTTEGQGKNS
jgi:sterol desaturase/sphingolipid hydroxylase (fatty acid hydroxylase superfamily)